MADKPQFLIYTTREGGPFDFGYPERFDEAVQTGRLDVTPGDRDPNHPDFKRDFVEPKYIALLDITADHDFILGHGR